MVQRLGNMSALYLPIEIDNGGLYRWKDTIAMLMKIKIDAMP